MFTVGTARELPCFNTELKQPNNAKESTASNLITIIHKSECLMRAEAWHADFIPQVRIPEKPSRH
jgi:hypothetical protein